MNFLTKPFLRAQGVNMLANLALTHGDQRRVGGFRLNASTFHPTHTFTSPARSRSPVYRDALKELAVDPARRSTVSADDKLAGWEVLHPSATENSTALTIKPSSSAVSSTAFECSSQNSALLDSGHCSRVTPTSAPISSLSECPSKENH